MKFDKNYLHTVEIIALIGIATLTLLVQASETNTPPASCPNAKEVVAKPSGCPMLDPQPAPTASGKTLATVCGQGESGCSAKQTSPPAAGCGHKSAPSAPTANP